MIKIILHLTLIVVLFVMSAAGCKAAENSAGVYLEQNKSLLEVIQVVRPLGYDAGYSTFPYGNLITELSNGEIEMWVFRGYIVDESRQQMNGINDIYEWLQPTAHSISAPKRAFVLFSKQEIEDQPYARQMKSFDPLYENGSFVVFDAAAVRDAHQ